MVEMLPDLSIASFRAFKQLEIEKLDRVNLITGKNNSGKSSGGHGGIAPNEG
jgi:AAA15 family ATPase/GTPase